MLKSAIILQIFISKNLESSNGSFTSSKLIKASSGPNCPYFLTDNI